MNKDKIDYLDDNIKKRYLDKDGNVIDYFDK